MQSIMAMTRDLRNKLKPQRLQRNASKAFRFFYDCIYYAGMHNLCCDSCAK